MFHVEHLPIIMNINESLNIYAQLINEYNSNKFNLTGFKTVEDIRIQLLDASYIDLNLLNVPRGTSFVDMGTGSGVPGVVLALYFPEYEFTLVDSNNKKIEFITMVVDKLGIKNVKAVSGRLEEYSRENSNTYDIAISRAFAPFYYSLEFGMTMLKKEGRLFIYSHFNNSNLSEKLVAFAQELGGEISEHPFAEGVSFRKLRNTPDKYPRRFAVIKREAAKIPETE
jgi:16S rRNA (guanine527-N7)-methyltransferase